MKISKTYFKLRGFKKTVDLCEEYTENISGKRIEKTEVYEISVGIPSCKQHKHAIITHRNIAYYDKNGKLTGRSNFYTLNCVGNGLRISDQFNLSYTKYDTDQLDAILKLIGLFNYHLEL